jgi:hypothetical protein
MKNLEIGFRHIVGQDTILSKALQENSMCKSTGQFDKLSYGTYVGQDTILSKAMHENSMCKSAGQFDKLFYGTCVEQDTILACEIIKGRL